MRLLCTGLVTFLICLGAEPRTVWEGVYTAEQAKRGEGPYIDSCAGCHREDLQAYNGVLLGARFMERWREDSLFSFYRSVHDTMPRGAAGSLPENTYLDIVAYILQANRFPAGNKELTKTDLTEIRVQGRGGAAPPPDFALVDAVGCLVEGKDGGWELSRGTEPVRTRNPEQSAADLAKAAEQPLAKHRYVLMDAETRHPEDMRNHIVMAKGFLIRNSSGDRINLTSIGPTANHCER